MNDFHFLRPYCLLLLIPLLLIAYKLKKRAIQPNPWTAVCDPHLLKALLIEKKEKGKGFYFMLLFLGWISVIVALAGPVWKRMPTPTYTAIEPKVIVLDLSPEMLKQDIPPNRLERAKFILHDIFKYAKTGQFGLVVFTQEPFVLSPLTDDAQTIDALLSAVSPGIMPVQGHALNKALEEASNLIKRSGFDYGQLLILTATPPDIKAIDTAKKLVKEKRYCSIIPLLSNSEGNSAFEQFANAGFGSVLPYPLSSRKLMQQFTTHSIQQTVLSEPKDDIPLWHDDGRWFLIPALLCLLPLFRIREVQA